MKDLIWRLGEISIKLSKSPKKEEREKLMNERAGILEEIERKAREMHEWKRRKNDN